MTRHQTQDFDFNRSPFLVFYEVTRACDLVCRHCRAAARREPDPAELTSGQSQALIDQLMQFNRPPLLVITGGDPIKRTDVIELTRYATERGLHTSMAPSATPLLDREVLRRLQNAGLKRIAISIDGVDADTHDALRGVHGTFQWAIDVVSTAREINLPVQINTTIHRGNVHQVDTIAEMLAEMAVVLWAVFFLVPVGRGLHRQRIDPPQYEMVFQKLWQQSQIRPFGIKTTEAPFYRRYVLQHSGDPQRGVGRGPLGINDGKGVMFISHTGEVHPSGFLPVDCGRFPERSIVDIYQNDPTFVALRDPDQLQGKCGKCEYRDICGGSRARAYALSGDPLAAEPDCVYLPKTRAGISV